MQWSYREVVYALNIVTTENEAKLWILTKIREFFVCSGMLDPVYMESDLCTMKTWTGPILDIAPEIVASMVNTRKRILVSGGKKPTQQQLKDFSLYAIYI